jgi:hypothetical protein
MNTQPMFEFVRSTPIRVSVPKPLTPAQANAVAKLRAHAIKRRMQQSFVELKKYAASF